MKARKLFATKALTPAKAPTISPEMTEFVTLSSRLRELLAKATEFFRGARERETKALATLEDAKRLKAPKDAKADEGLQLWTKACINAKKENEAYWADVTRGLDGLHRRAVAGRKRSVDPLDAAIKIGNELHNGFVDEAERKAKIEQDRIRKAAEDKAAEDRARELDELERLAVEGEQASAELSSRERAFAERMAALGPGEPMDGPAEAAAKAVGYRDPGKQAGRLLASVKVLEAIEGLRTAQAARSQAAAVSSVPVVASTPSVAPNVVKASGVSRRTYYSAEITDPVALRAAVDAGKVPADVLVFSQPKLNDYADSLKEGINAWPGVRLVVDRRLQ